MPPLEEYIQELIPIWETAWVTNNGPIHNEFESQVVDYLKVNNLVLFANGHLALSIAIKSFGLTGEVITTPFTFASTTHAIVENGLTPVFCDINQEDFTIDASQIESLITERTSAIVPVHVYGKVCNMVEINNVARKYNLRVIYDAAHAFGVEVDGVGIGNFGDASMFSFHATKLFHTIEGGALVFADRKLKQILNNKKNFGITSPETVEDIGLNAKLSEFHAAMGVVNLRYVDAQINQRQQLSELYSEQLAEIPGVTIVSDQPGVKHNYSYFPVLFNEKKYGRTRDDVFKILEANEIHARKYFYPLTSDFECYRGQFDSSLTPIAKYSAERILTLPLYGNLEINDVYRICRIIKDHVL
jgi:dTDP-4-amino-4,6-dideoxygalactose transaminase